MAKGKKGKMNRGKNPLSIAKIKLVRRKTPPSNPVLCVYMGKSYPSITAAAKATGKSRTYISKRRENL